MSTRLAIATKLHSMVRLTYVTTPIMIALAASGQEHPAVVERASNSHVMASYGALPLAFESNKGQLNPDVRFSARGNGYGLLLTDSESVLVLQKHSDCKHFGARADVKLNTCAAQADENKDVVRMKLAGVLSAPVEKVARDGAEPLRVTGEDELPGKLNYFIGNDPTQWRTDVPTYAKVRYLGVYPGIDLIYYGNQRQLEYDFVVAPKANPGAIRIAFEGGRLELDRDGNLAVTAPHGEISFHKPTVYQEIGGKHQSVEANFTLINSSTLGFTVGRYDGTRPLVIDPVLVYSTYLGGSGSNGIGDQGNGIAVDSTGSVYVVGPANSPDFPVTAGAFQTKNNAAAGLSTVFVTKLNATGTALVYSTFLGGSGGEVGYGIALDSANNAYVTGATYSQDFPVTCNAVRTTNEAALKSGASTGFVTKLNTEGNALVYSTFLGGSGNKATPAHGDVSQAIAVDSAGNAYVTGYTWSSDFPTTHGVFQPTADFAGQTSTSNAFVTKLNIAGTGLSYSTYLGGGGAPRSGDFGNAIAVDRFGDAFVAGSTDSAYFPVTPGAFQNSLKGPSTGFVTELNPKATAEVYSTYLGGSSGDSATAIALDGTGAAYVAGNTNSRDFPTTSGVIEPAGYWPGPATGFVTKLSADGSTPIYSTFLQGIGTTVAGLAVDRSGTAYIVGTAPTANAGAFGGFEVSPDALPTPASTGNSAFVVKLDPTATIFNYATLLGGSGNDGVAAVALDTSGNVYVTGIANSVDFPTTPGAFEAIAGTPSGALVATSLTLVSDSFQCSVSTPGYLVTVDLMVNSNSKSPAPTGTVNFFGSFSVGESAIPVSPGNDGTATVEVLGAESFEVAQSASWTAIYSGDSVYASSTLNGVTNGPGNCDSQPFAVSASQPRDQVSQPSTRVPAEPTSRPVKNALSRIAQPMNSTTTIASNAFVSKLALAGESNQTVYPAPANPPSLIDTSVQASPGSYGVNNAYFCGEDVMYSLYGTFNVQPVTASSLPITGTVVVESPGGGDSEDVSIGGFIAVGDARPPGQYTVTVSYLGDTNYKPSSTSFSFDFSCPDLGPPPGIAPQVSRMSTPRHAPVSVPVKPGLHTIRALQHGDLRLSGPKFALPLFAPHHLSLEAQSASAQTVACIAPPPVLSVKLNNLWRTYGAANPSLTYSISGLLNGDTVTVTPQTIATVSSPAGNYAITALVTGDTLSHYALSVTDATLTVAKAPLSIAAKNVAVQYGQTPAQPLPYTLTGFVNGDTQATAVSGAPALSSSVTSTSPVGFYPIQVGVGTLGATNYYFRPFSNGEGAVGVYKAPLTVRPTSFTIHVGDPLPAFTYSITGFVNGETQASATTGAPSLTTTALSTAKAGRYYIIGTVGSLKAQNYTFTPPSAAINGILTILK